MNCLVKFLVKSILTTDCQFIYVNNLKCKLVVNYNKFSF